MNRGIVAACLIRPGNCKTNTVLATSGCGALAWACESRPFPRWLSDVCIAVLSSKDVAMCGKDIRSGIRGVVLMVYTVGM